ncbi:lytic polysaccharide monooxygenase [Bipolaris oryzae ATCC 44560]|uniref:Lytic polysaccharide monooxygenase n=1 Tax=Bipolaris oryzae ATCC 44560 TaxID=930090 RepID=W6ZJ20_COCMI|nr:lytic polysaccharide monooxygenase [Bipolaris oryzae ATCC 44560]EUC47439.1 lytic polysaccharide monooxygenase [Bipolaris oryzae ATCC 44560]
MSIFPHQNSKVCKTAILSAILGSVTTVFGHGWIDVWNISGNTHTGFNPTAAPWVPDQGTIAWPAWNDDTGPVYSKNVNNPDIICSINATNAKIYANPVAAGSNITLHWTVWPDSHHGPIMTYLAACNGDCTTVDKAKLKWFKIAELGQLSLGTGGGKVGTWADGVLRAANGAWSVTIPASIKAGDYVVRNEIIALHSAYDVGAAQLYPQCANIKITGNGIATPEGVVGTSLYNAEDPGIHYNIYNDESKPVYPIPGPKLWTG